MSLRQIRLPVYTENPTLGPLESLWVSPHIVPATSDAFALMDSVSGCRPGGDVKYSAGGARKGESASPFNCRASTPAPDPSSSEDRRLRRQYRLTRGAELQALARTGRRVRSTLLDVRIDIRDGPNGRIGFIVPKHGRTAVRRNRLKRILRELTRLTLLDVLRASTAGLVMDIVMRARPAMYSASPDAIRAEFGTLRERLLRVPVSSASEGRAARLPRKGT